MFTRMPSDEAKTFFLGPVRHTVAHAIAALCASGAVYRTRCEARGPVVIDGVELASSFEALRRQADLMSREEVDAFFAAR